LIALVLAFIGFLFIVEQYNSYKKVDSLNKQKSIISTILQQQNKSNSVNYIEFNSQAAIVYNITEKLLNQQSYNYLSNFILDNTQEYVNDLKQLSILIKKYIKVSREYYELTSEDKNLEKLLNEINSMHFSIISSIDSILLKNILYDSAKFDIFNKIFLLLLMLLSMITIWQRKVLNSIYNDIRLLTLSNNSKKNKQIFSQEVDAISLRMNRKMQITDNPSMIDQITEISNNKGMLQLYSERKGLKDNYFNSITILEIDNFSKSKRAFSQDFIQAILKKVAYTISLHEQSTDIIARTDYNQFTLIFARVSKEQLFKDIDLIRQNISEIKLVSPDRKKINITVTGGFIIKPHNSPLEDYIRKAKALLESAKHIGINRILQTKDIVQ